MSDKTAAEALVASLRQKRKLKQEALRASSAGFREKSPDPNDESSVDDDIGNEQDLREEIVATTKSKASLVEDEGPERIDDGDETARELGQKNKQIDDNERSPSSLSPPSRTDSATSVRERMRQKMLARRGERSPLTTAAAAAAMDGETSERETSGGKSWSMTSRRLRGLRDAKSTSMTRTRFDVAESKNDDELEQELATRTLNMRERWKRAVASTDDPTAVRRHRGPTDEEAFDFFTGKFDDDEADEEQQPLPEVATKSTNKGQVKTDGELLKDEEAEMEEVTKKLISDFFDDDVDDPLDFVHFVEADYIRRWEREALIGKSLYVPGGVFLTAEDKLRIITGGGSEHEEDTIVKSDVETNDGRFQQQQQQQQQQRLPRDWESEGFYVGAPPYVTLGNRNKMESRLLAEPDGSGRKWFRADGMLDSAPLPLKTVATRPPIEVEYFSEDIETRFVDPVVDPRSPSFCGGISGDDAAAAVALENGFISKNNLRSLHYLQVDLRQLSFTHHHYFSEEHVISSRLEQLYAQYVDHRKKDDVALKNLKIETLRQSFETMKDRLKTLEKSNVAEEIDSEIAAAKNRLKTRLRAHRAELTQIVQLRNVQMKIGRALTQNILSQWKALKAVRERRGYALTGGKLGIIKEDADEAKDRAWWEREVAAAVEVKRGDFEEKRSRKMETYRKELEVWRRARKAVKDEKKNKKKKNKTEEDEEAIMTEEEDVSVASAADRETAAAAKPEKPTTFDEDAAIAAAIEIGRAHWRKPGDPVVLFEWAVAGQPISVENVPLEELRRREAVNNLKIVVRVVYNGKEVMKTPPKSPSNDFTVPYNASFQLSVQPSSADLKLEIYESTSFASSTFLAELFAPLPELSSSGTEETLQFSCSRVFPAKFGVGSGGPSFPGIGGVSLGDGDNAQTSTTPLTSGSIGVRVYWTSPDNDHQHFSPRASPFVRGALSSMTMLKRGDIMGASAGLTDKTKLRNWLIHDSSLDPNDPKNADLLQLFEDPERDDIDVLDRHSGGDGIMPVKSHSNSKKDYFRLDHDHREFDFCTDEELDSDPRFRLLEMRNRKIPEFRNLKMIPAFAAEIPADVFTAYETRVNEEKAVDKTAAVEEDPSDVDAKRRRMIRFLQKVRKQVADRFQQASKYKTVKDVVIEEEIPNVSTLAASIYSLQARFARPLHPIRVPRKANVQGSSVPGAPGGIGPDVGVYVNVLRAFNLPTREEVTASSSVVAKAPRTNAYGGVNPFVVSAAASRFQRGVGGGDNTGRFTPSPPAGRAPDDDFSPSDAPPIRPFVEVMFQRKTARTSTSEGSNASWNEELRLPFHPPNEDFSPTALQKVVDVIHVTLFDEVVTDISEAEEETATTKIVRQSVVNKWLGCIKIPFTTLFFNGKIEGTFRVNTPTVLLGYRKSKEGFLNDQYRSTGNHSYLHFYLTLDPALSPADPIRERFDSSESEQLLTKADEFVDKYNASFPDRTEVTTTVINLQGKSVFVTRFVRPILPPSELMIGPNWQTASSAARVARFVACIPNVSDSAFFAGMCDLWSTCDQFLAMMTGDEEVHAVLLLNFFLAMGKTAWLMLGIAIPEGPTTYVLTKESIGGGGDFWLWNPSSGVKYSVKDSFCPVTQIHSLINDQNIWLNMQPRAQPAQMNFDLSLTRDWSAFFGVGNFLNPGLSSVQPETLRYAAIDETYVRSLTEKLERAVRENVMRWRPKQITRWNRLCSQALEKLLPSLEEAAASVGGDSDADQSIMMEPLTPFLSSYSLTGFPLHATFTDNGAILDAVYATGIHNNASPDVEFALGVYIHAYPAHVLSVWIYVASLEKKAE